MGIALRNGIALGVKLLIVGFITAYFYISVTSSPGGNGILVPLGFISPFIYSIIIMDQAKVVAREVQYENKSE